MSISELQITGGLTLPVVAEPPPAVIHYQAAKAKK